MNWLGKLLGHRDVEFPGSDFHVRIKSGFREIAEVIYTRAGTTLSLGGERIGKEGEGISVLIPQEFDSTLASRIASDLATAFQGMQYGYVIAHQRGTGSVPEGERQSAIAELREMGYEVEVSADRKQIRQTKLPNAPRIGIDTARKQAPRMMQLLQAIHGTRPRLEILARSKEFQWSEGLIRDVSHPEG